MHKFNTKKHKSKKGIIWTLVILVVGFSLIYLGRQDDNLPSQNFDYLIGKPAPTFNMTDLAGNVYTPEKLKGKNVVLFFNEGLICYPACWDEMLALANDTRFKDNNTVVLSVVVDSKEQWQTAINKLPELKQANIVFDENASASKSYGMLNVTSTMHKGQLPGHSYVVIDKNGVIRSVLDDIKMGKNSDQLISDIKKINN